MQIRNPFVRLKDAFQPLGVSRAGYYAGVKAKTLPVPIKLGLRAAALLANEIEQINDARTRNADVEELKALVCLLHAARTQASR